MHTDCMRSEFKTELSVWIDAGLCLVSHIAKIVLDCAGCGKYNAIYS